ncbi:MAG: transcription-repair coupling factor [Spirochaetia bacterium]
MITLFQNKLNTKLNNYRPFLSLLKQFRGPSFTLEIEGMEGAFFSMILERLFRNSKAPFLVITPTQSEAESLEKDLLIFTEKVYLFPWWDTVPLSGKRTPFHTAGERIHRLVRLVQGEPAIYITSLRSFLTPVPPPDFVKNHLITIKRGMPLDPVDMENKLQRLRYLRVPRVSVPGEFALRGEVLDIFLPGYDEAVRVVFEWDEVEEIRLFDPVSQNSTDTVDKIDIYPSSEIVWDEERLENLRKLLPQDKSFVEEAAEKMEASDEMFLFPATFEKLWSLSDYLGKQAVQFLVNDERLESGFEALKKEYLNLYRDARAKQRPAVKPEKLLINFDEVKTAHNRNVLIPAIKNPEKERIRFSYEGPRSYFGNVNYMKSELSALMENGYDITVCAETEAQAQRIEQLLQGYNVSVIASGISSGFRLPELQLMLIQENEIFGRRKRRPASVKRAKSAAIDTFVELNPGDLVVHINYGIGRFKGIDRIQAAGTERDYIELEYANEETVFIPIEQVNLIQRYIGQEGYVPRLDTLGGKSWERRKNHVRKSVEDLAERLVALYARRKAAQGFVFQPDSDWQVDFEAEFPYEETEDQLRSIEEVKADMEKQQPMDRLICGDVGYGKTEVAMRAAFKAVVSGKQVAFLAPTTILAEQHYETFTERFNRFPVEIEMISRFVPKTQQKNTIERTKKGEVDILIGTHRVLQKDVHFKSLGLLVVDEEQRFGVKDKERLKELKTSVDVLTLSATPIPRTLHMSLLQIRDMSVITTPPVDRRPIETYVKEFDEEEVAKAIRHEVKRGGQIFYLHNRVETLEQVKQFLERLVPEVMVETAHGRLSSLQLEDIMHRFVHGAFQVLVATTIIENGIDIPNVNTIIIDRADMYGISQLYQLRGRVGRSDRTAYAYLLFPENRAISDIAMKRLQIVSDYTELGSGFKVAMKDLEVRGAGNLLGRQQHGEILSVGFDMYLRMLDEAVANLKEKDEEKEKAPEVYLELDYSGYIPEDYIRDASEKMEIYKMIAAVETEQDLDRVVAELTDRFGPMPDEVSSFLSIAELRIICRKLYIGSLKERRGNVHVEFAKVSRVDVNKVMRLIQEGGGNVRLDPHNPNVLLMSTEAIALKDKTEFIREKLQTLL